MATVTITTIEYGNTAGGDQSWQIEYKLASDPGVYTVAESDAVANELGLLYTPVDVNGIVLGNVYIFRVSNNCGSPREYYHQYISA